MNKNKYEYDTLIPKSFVVGISEDGVGFLTMKDENGKWTNLSAFEKHCGFKPYEQMDAVKELNKAVTQRVRAVENAPTGGFRLVNLSECVYFTSLFSDDNAYVRLRDPRGWDVSVYAETLQSLLDANGGNIKDGEIVGVKLMYCWPKYKNFPFSVAIADAAAANMQKATDDFVSARDKIASVKPADLKIGKVYTSRTSKLAGNKYMYMGKHDVFSADLQLNAVMRKSYSDLKKYIDDRTDITSVGRYVFYCIDAERSQTRWGITNNEPGLSPYYVTGSVSKLFDKEETGVDPSKFSMHNSSDPCTYENVREDMSRSAMFNMIDFAAPERYVKVDASAAEDVFAYLHGYSYAPSSYRAFPFYCDARGIFMQTSRLNVKNGWTSRYDITIRSDAPPFCAEPDADRCYSVIKPSVAGEWRGGSEPTVYKTYHKKAGETGKDVFVKLLKELEPEVKQYVFLNGKTPAPIQNLLLNRRTKLKS